MNLNDIVPWGRNFEEYRAMFALSEEDLKGSILGCGDGPASFNAEATKAGVDVVSADPLYAHTAEEITGRIDTTFGTVMHELWNCEKNYVWNRFPGPDHVGRTRARAMQRFLTDYERQGKERYVPASLPNLPFDDGRFDLAVCSHLLFLYSDQLPLGFHVRAVREMLRVATEVRIFPLLSLSCKRSSHVDPVCDDLRNDGFVIEEQTVDYEFQRGADTMLRLRRPS